MFIRSQRTPIDATLLTLKSAFPWTNVNNIIRFTYELQDLGAEFDENFGRRRWALGMYRQEDILDLEEGDVHIFSFLLSSPD